jgi:hypothetical protein
MWWGWEWEQKIMWFKIKVLGGGVWLLEKYLWYEKVMCIADIRCFQVLVFYALHCDGRLRLNNKVMS